MGGHAMEAEMWSGVGVKCRVGTGFGGGRGRIMRILIRCGGVEREKEIFLGMEQPKRVVRRVWKCESVAEKSRRAGRARRGWGVGGESTHGCASGWGLGWLGGSLTEEMETSWDGKGGGY